MSPVATGLLFLAKLAKLNMLDLKTFKSALEQLEEERKIPKEKILDAIEQAMAAAYKKDYGKKGQIIRAKFDLDTGKTNFFQVFFKCSLFYFSMLIHIVFYLNSLVFPCVVAPIGFIGVAPPRSHTKAPHK